MRRYYQNRTKNSDYYENSSNFLDDHHSSIIKSAKIILESTGIGSNQVDQISWKQIKILYAQILRLQGCTINGLGKEEFLRPELTELHDIIAHKGESKIFVQCKKFNYRGNFLYYVQSRDIEKYLNNRELRDMFSNNSNVEFHFVTTGDFEFDAHTKWGGEKYIKLINIQKLKKIIYEVGLLNWIPEYVNLRSDEKQKQALTDTIVEQTKHLNDIKNNLSKYQKILNTTRNITALLIIISLCVIATTYFVVRNRVSETTINPYTAKGKYNYCRCVNPDCKYYQKGIREGLLLEQAEEVLTNLVFPDEAIEFIVDKLK